MCPRLAFAPLWFSCCLASSSAAFTNPNRPAVKSFFGHRSGWDQEATRSPLNTHGLTKGGSRRSVVDLSAVFRNEDDANGKPALLDAAAEVFVSSASSYLVGVRSVGVDFGLVRTGVATTVGYDPLPLTILSRLNETEVIEKVVRFCASEVASRVVVGLPIHKNGTESERSIHTREFATKLACTTYAEFGPSFSVHLWDERYSSKEAAARAMASNSRATDLYGSLDADAACIILEHYYAAAAEGVEVVAVPESLRDVCEMAWQRQRAEGEQARNLVQGRRREGLDARKMAMERARKLEEKLEKSGMLGTSKKKGKKAKKAKNKKKRSSGGKDWIVM